MLCERIPYDATSVVYINTRVFAQKLKPTSPTDTAKEFWKFIACFPNVKNIKSCGIDFLSDAAMVTHNGYSYFLMQLQDQEAWNKSIESSEKGKFSNIKKWGPHFEAISLKDSFKWIWTSEVLVGFSLKNWIHLTDRYNKFLNVESKNSFSQNPLCSFVQNNEVPIWFYSSSFKNKYWQFDTINGHIEFDTILHVYAGNSILTQLQKTSKRTEIHDSIAVFHKSSDDQILASWIKNLSVFYLSASNAVIPSLNYNKLESTLILGGEKQIEKKSIRYEYDEDFNRKTIAVSTFDTIKTGCLQYRIIGSKSYTNVCSHTSHHLPSLSFNDAGLAAYARFNSRVFSDLYPFSCTFTCEFTHMVKADKHSCYLDVRCNNWTELIKSFYIFASK